MIGPFQMISAIFPATIVHTPKANTICIGVPSGHPDTAVITLPADIIAPPNSNRFPVFVRWFGSDISLGGSQRVRFCDPLITLEIAGQRALCASSLRDNFSLGINKN